jgi:hypothetical protein
MSKIDLYDLEYMLESICERIQKAQEIFIETVDTDTTPIELRDYFNENILDINIYDFCKYATVKFVDESLIVTIDPMHTCWRTRALTLKKALFDCKDEELKDFILDEIKMLIHNKIVKLKTEIEIKNSDLKSLYKIHSKYNNK